MRTSNEGGVGRRNQGLSFRLLGLEEEPVIGGPGAVGQRLCLSHLQLLGLLNPGTSLKRFKTLLDW
jgi:hypothetical protein